MIRSVIAICALLAGTALLWGCGSDEPAPLTAADKGPVVPEEQLGAMGGKGGPGEKGDFVPPPVNPPVTPPGQTDSN